MSPKHRRPPNRSHSRIRVTAAPSQTKTSGGASPEGLSFQAEARVAPVVLAILDGWGYRSGDDRNAIHMARTPVMDALWHAYPHTLVSASGGDVGLPDGQMGNSEVGHLTIGAGRIIRQELVRIGQAVRDGSIARNPVLNALADRLVANGGTLHLFGLVSDGGVHSHVDHVAGLLQWARARGLGKVCIHALTDGRDTPDRSAEGYLATLQSQIDAAGVGSITTLCGRYWAMDRDNRWDRIEKAYRLLTEESPIGASDAAAAIAASYADGISDEFLEPVRLAPGVLSPGDGFVCFNLRPDRVRQIVRGLVLEDFDAFPRERIKDLDVVTFTQYERGLPVSVAFPPQELNHLLGDVVSSAGLRQFRTAETEKYPHVTYFMNGGNEKPLPGEDRHLVPSPLVATYDKAPSMSAAAVTDGVVAAINKGIYSLIVVNYANPDMVGHTGVMQAAMQAIETVDGCVGRLVEAANRAGGTLLITADHGNAETMKSEQGKPWTAHTCNPVPLIFVEGEKLRLPGHGNHVRLREGGGLADLAPTLLQILGLPVPAVMTGTSLVSAPDFAPLPLAPQPLSV